MDLFLDSEVALTRNCDYFNPYSKVISHHMNDTAFRAI